MNYLNIDDVISVEIVEVATYGIKIKFMENNGFIQIPELSWDTYGLNDKIDSFCKAGDNITVKIISITENLFYASVRELNPNLNPWCIQNIPRQGAIITATVLQETEFGYYIKLSNFVVSVIENTDKNELKLKKEQQIKVKILSVNKERKKINVIYVDDI